MLLKINGVDLTNYVKSLKIDYEVIVSSNSGRNASATMCYDIVGRKDKLNVVFRPTNENEMSTLLNLIYGYEVTLTYWNARTKSEKTIQAYINTPSPDIYTWQANKKLFKDLSVNFIEL